MWCVCMCVLHLQYNINNFNIQFISLFYIKVCSSHFLLQFFHLFFSSFGLCFYLFIIFILVLLVNTSSDGRKGRKKICNTYLTFTSCVVRSDVIWGGERRRKLGGIYIKLYHHPHDRAWGNKFNRKKTRKKKIQDNFECAKAERKRWKLNFTSSSK